MKRLAILSNTDPFDRMTFSGTSHSMVRELEKYYDLVWINPTTKLSNGISRVFNRRQRGKFFLNLAPLWVSRFESAKLNREVKRQKIDAIFNIGMAVPLMYYDQSAKLMSFADATIGQMIEHYYEVTPEQQAAIDRVEKREKIAFDRSDAILTSSQWCSNSVIHDYSVDPKKVSIVKLGANMAIDCETKTAPTERSIHILFCGVDPVRKGLGIAADAVAKLNQLDPDHDYVLDVVGLKSAPGITGDHVIYHGLLNKNKPEEEAQLKDFYRKSHLMILPTRLDTIGIVFLEAASYGLPTLTCDTGGVPEYVIDGEMGYCLSLEADGDDFAAKALELIQSPDKYEAFSKRSVELIKQDMNWQVWGQRTKQLIDQMLG